MNADNLKISVHGENASIETAIEVAEATKKLLGALADTLGVEDLAWQIDSVQFKCDGCGLLRPNKPRQGEGWTYSGGDDLCPECTAARLRAAAESGEDTPTHGGSDQSGA